MTLFCVGDTDQLLYRFQGAKPELLTGELEQWLPNIQTHKLETNYRSTDEIINKSQQLIAHNYSDLGGPYPQEFMKTMTGVKGQGEPIEFMMHQTADEEAMATGQKINELVQQGYSFGDFFIGARTRAQLGYVEGALVRAGIKFINITGGSFWQSRHVLDVVSYLRLAYDTGNKEALEQVYNIPSAQNKYTWNDKQGRFQAGDYCSSRYLGKEFLAKINYQFDSIDKVLLGRNGWRYQTKAKDYSVYGPSKAQDLQEFVWSLRGLLDQADNVGQVIRAIIDDCYEKYLRSSDTIGDEGLVNAKLEDLATVEDLASRFNSPELFLSYVDENIQAAEDAKNRDWGDYVVLSTYHRLKGLERLIMIGLGWCEGENTMTGESVGLLPHTFSLTPPPDFGVLPSGGMSPVPDERCIGYVGVSRAEEKVYLSGIKNYRAWRMWPSRFIYEMELAENEH
jgi:DNA helicase-2/ATP-dependent DNA helicase PcrA